MELFFNSLRNVFFGLIVLVLNIPVFWSFQGFIDFVKNALKLIGLDF
jgi:hypothetical protein